MQLTIPELNVLINAYRQFQPLLNLSNNDIKELTSALHKIELERKLMVSAYG